MTCPQYDFHIHTKYLGCANATMEIPAIIQECERLGMTCLGITDHLNTLDKVELHIPIREDLEKSNTEMEVYLGVEFNFTGYDQNFAFNPEIKERYGFQFAIGGIHSSYLEEYDLKKLIDIQHQHHLKTCQDPLVQVLVHPYWFGKGEFDRSGWPWFNSMNVIPESYIRELGQVAKETGTAIEINGSTNLENSSYSEDYVREYVDYLAILAEEGVVFSVGSDAHDIRRLATVQATWQVIDKLGIPSERVWRPEGKPMVGGNRVTVE